jgi:hypothetical protein
MGLGISQRYKVWIIEYFICSRQVAVKLRDELESHLDVQTWAEPELTKS